MKNISSEVMPPFISTLSTLICFEVLRFRLYIEKKIVEIPYHFILKFSNYSIYKGAHVQALVYIMNFGLIIHVINIVSGFK